jgi:3-dehydroquinate dehydratase-2
MLGVREPEIYGRCDYAALCSRVSAYAEKNGAGAEFFQSNIEGEIVSAIQAARGVYDAIIINPGAYTHYSYAIYDALLSAGLPAVEVHISNVHGREEFRKVSVTASACVGQISGLGFYGYEAAMEYFIGEARRDGGR